MAVTDEQKFSVSLPHQEDYAYLRVWDPDLQLKHMLGWEAGVPSSRRIVKGMMRIPEYSILE
eukprot:4637473-Ditylum_brightwellii.AAC.1